MLRVGEVKFIKYIIKMYTKKYCFNMLLQYMYSPLYLTSIESIPEVAFYVYEQIKIIKETKTRLASAWTCCFIYVI